MLLEEEAENAEKNVLMPTLLKMFLELLSLYGKHMNHSAKNSIIILYS